MICKSQNPIDYFIAFHTSHQKRVNPEVKPDDSQFHSKIAKRDSSGICRCETVLPVFQAPRKTEPNEFQVPQKLSWLLHLTTVLGFSDGCLFLIFWYSFFASAQVSCYIAMDNHHVIARQIVGPDGYFPWLPIY